LRGVDACAAWMDAKEPQVEDGQEGCGGHHGGYRRDIQQTQYCRDEGHFNIGDGRLSGEAYSDGDGGNSEKREDIQWVTEIQHIPRRLRPGGVRELALPGRWRLHLL
jgi:hypothetical protein